MTIREGRRERVVMIGQAPTRLAKPDEACLTGRPASLILSLLGFESDAVVSYAKMFCRENLIPTFPGKAVSGHGDAFPMAEARIRASRMAPRLHGRCVVLWGRSVAAAFGVTGEVCQLIDHTFEGAQFVVGVIPHPSGLNRWWNSQENRIKAGEFLRGAFVVARHLSSGQR